MLELRLNADAKRIAAMREAVAQECRRSKADDAHAAAVASVVEQLIAGESPGRRKRGRCDVFVVVTVQSDATMLMVRDQGLLGADLDERRHRLLDERTVTWSTISGAEGRTIWAEIARSTPVPAALVPAPVSAPVPTEAPVPLVTDVPVATPRVDPELVSVLPAGD